MSDPTATARLTPWRIRGSYFESCNCDAICPCRMVGGRKGGRSTHGICFGVLSWLVEEGHAGDVAKHILGTLETNPALWASMSPYSSYKDVSAPVRIFHGTADTDVPYDWSVETEKLLRESGKDVTLLSFVGEGHEFSARWNDFMKEATRFLREKL